MKEAENEWLLAAAPRESHPGPCWWVRRAMLWGRSTRESHYPACASSPTGCHTCFTARFCRSPVW